MKTFETARDIVELAREFHGQVADLYDRLGNQAEKKRVKMLLAYMGRHERHLAACLAQFGESTGKRVLETWFQFVPCDIPVQAIANVKAEPTMSVDDVVSIAMELDDCLIRIYRQASEECDSRELTEVFANLLKMEEQEEVRLTRDCLGVKAM